MMPDAGSDSELLVAGGTYVRCRANDTGGLIHVVDGATVELSSISVMECSAPNGGGVS